LQVRRKNLQDYVRRLKSKSSLRVTFLVTIARQLEEEDQQQEQEQELQLEEEDQQHQEKQEQGFQLRTCKFAKAEDP